MTTLEGNMNTYCLEVWGDFACFTRPEMKVERVSYDVITPSAARAIFEAILWKPAIRWQVRRIEVLKPIRWMTLKRNEVGGLATDRSGGDGYRGLFIEDDRQQRAGLFLRDVAYRLHAELHFDARRDPDAKGEKYRQMFERRVRRGQCVNQPYLGCREFAAAFTLIAPGSVTTAPIAESRDLGFMLYDLDFSDPHDPQPRFFRSLMNSGVIDLPGWSDPEVLA
jgi:CRISPR-associated protein Cas5d